jgi:hypothetical protein
MNVDQPPYAVDTQRVTTNGPLRGWFRDPSGQFDARYWNGQSWSPFVLRGNNAQLDADHTAPGLDGTSDVWADFEGRLADWPFRVQVTGSTLTWQNETVSFRDVLGVTCRVAGSGANSWFEMLLEHHNGELEMRLPIGQMDAMSLRECERSVAAMLGSFEANLFPAIAFERAVRIFGGEPFAVGSVCITSVGITKSGRFRTRTLTWSQFLNLKTNDRELIVMVGKPDGGSEEFAAVPVCASNALLLTRVIESLLMVQMPSDHRAAYLARPVPPGANEAWAVMQHRDTRVARDARDARDASAEVVRNTRVARDTAILGAAVEYRPNSSAEPIGSALLANFSSVLASVAERDRVLADARERDEVCT